MALLTILIATIYLHNGPLLNLAKLHASGLFTALFDIDEVGLGSDSEGNTNHLRFFTMENYSSCSIQYHTAY